MRRRLRLGVSSGCIPICLGHGKHSHSKHSLTIFQGRLSLGCGEECVTWVGAGSGWRTGAARGEAPVLVGAP